MHTTDSSFNKFVSVAGQHSVLNILQINPVLLTFLYINAE